MRRITTVLGTLGLLLAVAAPAQASTGGVQEYPGVEVVHQEQVAVGPYELTVGFSEWPVHALQSLDITFAPSGGIDQVQGTITAVSPSGEEDHLRRPPGVDGMPRHPRQPDVWGLDVFALSEPGDWTFTFGLNGPEGPATASMTIPVLEQPGPPLGISWLVSLVPLLVLVGLLTTAARRSGRERIPA